MNDKMKNITFKLSQKNIGNYCLSKSFDLFKIQDVKSFLKENQNIECFSNINFNLIQKLFGHIKIICECDSNQTIEMITQVLYDNIFHLNDSDFNNQKIEHIKQIVSEQLEQIKDINYNPHQILYFLNSFDCIDNLKIEDKIVQIFERYYDEIVSQEVGEVFNNKCICYKNVKIQNYLTKDLPFLKKIEYSISQSTDCKTIQRELAEQIDFFDLKNKQQVVEFQIQMHQKYVSMLYKQLQNNGQNINTLKLRAFNKSSYKFKVILFYKLKYLVSYQCQ
ncbi:hypothetical protein ABPG74_019771 [Tetrahymena malaccensis]